MVLENINVTKNIRIIEWLKSELLTSVARLFAAFSNNTALAQEAVLSAVSNIIIVAYLLAKRLGIDFVQIDLKVSSKLKLEIEENHELEKNFGDLSALMKHFEISRTKKEAEI